MNPSIRLLLLFDEDEGIGNPPPPGSYFMITEISSANMETETGNLMITE